MTKAELENEISTLRMQNRFAAIQYSALTDEIDNFFGDLQTKHGDLCRQILNLEREIMAYEVETKQKGASAKKSKFLKEERSSNSLNVILVTNLFPELPRADIEDAEYKRKVNKAYNESNFDRLLKMDEEMSNGKAKVEFLKKYKKLIIEVTKEIKFQHDEMENNQICKFVRKGKKDNEHESRDKLLRRIYSLKNQLIDSKISYLESLQKQITTAN